MTNQEIRQHELMHGAMSSVAPIEAHFGPKPDDYTPLSPENVGPIKASMQFENVARNMGAQVMQLEHEVTHDKLTNAETKQACHDALQELIAEGKNPHVFYLDFNHFKSVNDWAGHQAGDQTLIMITASLLERLRPGEKLYRLGGDEFLIVKDPTVAAEDRRNREQTTNEILDMRSGKDRREEDDSVEGVKKRIQQAFEQTVEPLTRILGVDLVSKMGISVGHAEYKYGQMYDELIAAADDEMYKHKDETKKAQAEADRKKAEADQNKTTSAETLVSANVLSTEAVVKPGPSNEELVQRYQEGDERALEDLIDKNMGLIQNVANRSYLRALVEDSGVMSNDDLVQVGRMTLWDCAAKFVQQPDKEGGFSAYLKRALETSMKQTAARFHPLHTLPKNALDAGYASKDERYANRVDSAAKGLEHVRRTKGRVLPLDTVASRGDSKGPRGKVVHADDTNVTSMTMSPGRDLLEDVETRVDSGDVVKSMLDILNEQERAIVKSRVGLGNGKPLGRVDAAAAIGLQLDRFSKTEQNAFRKLRTR